jgi:hypothetical protein
VDFESTPTPASYYPDKLLLQSLYHRIFTPSEPLSTPKLSSSFNLVKGLAALLQSLYASFTLVRTNDGQVHRFGFAAPGLTVLPYAVMSTLNLTANLVAPHYPTLYLVRSKVMDEAEGRTGLRFRYAVGEIIDESEADNLLYVSGSAEKDETIEIREDLDRKIYVPACPRFRRTDNSQTTLLRQFIESPQHGLQFPRYQLSSLDTHRVRRSIRRGLFDLFPSFTFFFAEVFIILGLSRLSGRHSTVPQRAWTISWLIAGLVGDSISDLWKLGRSPMVARLRVCSLMVAYGAPAIGGFIVVIQMLKAYGICHRFV